MAAVAIAAAAAGVLSAIMGLYQGEKARNAESARLKELQAAFDALKPPQYDFTIESPPELVNNLADDPRFNTALSSRYTPQVAEFIDETAPELIKETPQMTKGREAQEAALAEYQRISGGQEDPRFRALVERARNKAQGEAQARGATLAQSMARRGISGSGIELASQMGSNAESMDRIADMEMQAAGDAYRNRLEALSQGAQLGGQLRSQDQSMQEKNLQLINDFNRRQTDRRQNRANDMANAVNDAQAKNISLDQWKYGAGEANMNRNNLINTATSEWRRRSREDNNRLLSNKYNDEMDRLRGRFGLAAEANKMGREHARDNTNIIGGLTDSLAKIGAKAFGGEDKDEEKEYWKRKRELLG